MSRFSNTIFIHLSVLTSLFRYILFNCYLLLLCFSFIYHAYSSPVQKANAHMNYGTLTEATLPKETFKGEATKVRYYD